MLLTITTTHHPATDLGYLLHKNPAKLHSFDLSFGKAHIFYPGASAERGTAALLVDIDTVGLVPGFHYSRGSTGSLSRAKTGAEAHVVCGIDGTATGCGKSLPG